MNSKVLENTPRLWLRHFPRPQPQHNKYDRGHAAVLSGGLSSTGAARLAARGALRAGAGLVTLATPKEALLVNATASAAVMVRQIDTPQAFSRFVAEKKVNAAILGPGGGVGDKMRRFVLAALKLDIALVLDADALTSFAKKPGILFSAIKTRKFPAVLTPHEGEFARLFGDQTGTKPNRALAAAKLSGAIILIKGADTAIATPDGRICICNNAPPFLATAGSGDVLAGIIAGMLAQQMPAFEAVAAAAWLHGEAAKTFGPGLIAEDIPEQLPEIYKRLLAN